MVLSTSPELVGQQEDKWGHPLAASGQEGE